MKETPQSKHPNSKSVVLLNTDDFTGGAAIACRRLLKALRTYTSLQVRMVVQESRSGQEGVEALDTSWFQQKSSWLRFVAERLYFYFFEKSKAIRFLFNPAKFGRNVVDNQAIAKADIVHLHWINFGFLSIDSLKNIFQTQKPIVWTLHDMWAFTGGCHYAGDCSHYQNTCGNCEEFLKKPSNNDLSHQVWKNKKEVFSNANLHIVTCSEWLATQARESSLFKDKPTIAIPNPIDIQLFKPFEKNIACAYFNLSLHKKYILFASVKISDTRKGFAYFQEALTIVNERYVNTQLASYEIEILIFGDAQSADFESLPFKVNLLGKLSTIDKIVMAYSAASVFVIPSLAENLPNTVMEAMACGTPVVGFEVGGIPEMIDHEKLGYLAKYKSADDLAKGIEYILQHPDYKSLCQNARQKVVENYSEEVVAGRYLALYESLLLQSEIQKRKS